jgi:hypothetical protein
MSTQPETIKIKSDAFYALLDEVIEHINNKISKAQEEQWVDSATAMKILNIKSRTTLQALRDKGKIRFTQPNKKNILFDRASLLAYLELHAQKPF